MTRSDLLTHTQGGSRKRTRTYLIGVARAAAGALLFALPMLMTMEMWWLGFSVAPARLALFLVLMLPVLVRVSYLVGFEETFSLIDGAVDTLVAFGVAFGVAAFMLALFGVLKPDMAFGEVVGKVVIQVVPASLGALLAQSQLGVARSPQPDKAPMGFGDEHFTMAVGALFLGFNLAPTDEMVVIALHMTPLHAAAAVLVSLVIMHVFVYNVDFSGEHADDMRGEGGEATFMQVFLRFTLIGYFIVLFISLFLLWTFGRLDGVSPYTALVYAIVLGVPGAVGAAAARLIL